MTDDRACTRAPTDDGVPGDLDAEYAEATREWADSEDNSVWEAVVGDGVD